MESLRATVRGGLITFGEIDWESKWKHLRGKVTTFSRNSRGRLCRYLATCVAKYRTMLTLTVPLLADEVDTFSFKHRLDVMLEWLRCQAAEQFPGQLWSACWVLEFQKRGAPHIHCLLTHPCPYEKVAARWCVIWANAISGDAMERMSLASTRIETLRSRAHASQYIARYLGKEESKTLPSGCPAFGRWWGVRGNRSRLPPRFFEYDPLPLKYSDKNEFMYLMLRGLAVLVNAYSPAMRIIKWKFGRGISFLQRSDDEKWADFVGLFERFIQSWGLIKVSQYSLHS